MTGYGYWTDKGIFQVAFATNTDGQYSIVPGDEGSNWCDIFPVFNEAEMSVGKRILTFENGEGFDVNLVRKTETRIDVFVEYSGSSDKSNYIFLTYGPNGEPLPEYKYTTIIFQNRPPFPVLDDCRGYIGYSVGNVYEVSSYDWETSEYLPYVLPGLPVPIGELPSDPFEPGGGSGTGGGGGSFDNTSTPIDIPGLPSISAASTGFISLYNPTLSQLNELSSYLWSDLFSIDTLKKLFANPMDAILGLSILPVAIPGGGAREVKVGNIGTGISLTVAASQFVEVDCGSIDVNEYWGAYLDYEPYTQAQIFLPYIGTHPISVDEIMGKTVRVVYHIDILTGACCCFVKCGSSVLYTYNGQCSIPIPITAVNYASVINGILTIAGSAAALVATGGLTATMAAPTIAGMAGASGALIGAAQTAANQIKPHISKSGPISGSAGVLNMQTPYLILTRPRQALPSKQNEFMGYPSLITVQLTELTGYTEVQSIHLENIPATQEELAEIETLLMGGVIF